VFKNKKDKEYKLFNNTLFDDEKKAEHFGKSSMKRGFEHKVLEKKIHLKTALKF